MKPKHPPGPLMSLGKMRVRFIFFTLLIFSSSASAENCFTVDVDENRPVATLSGRITNRHQKMPRNSELRAAELPYLKLDAPLQADAGGGCMNWGEIPVIGSENQIAKWQNRHVTISGKLNRFGSALVHPPIFIEVTTIKGE
jgi:hypothetical protein